MTTQGTTFTFDLVGQVGVKPRLVRLITELGYDDIIAAGWVNTLNGIAAQFDPSDLVFAYGSDGHSILYPEYTGSSITLTPIS